MAKKVQQKKYVRNKKSLFEIDDSIYLIKPFDSSSLKKLDKYEEFRADAKLPLTKLKNYIILLYDINSEMREQISDLGQRKSLAAEVAGFPLFDGKFHEGVEDMMIGRNKKFNDMLVRYITLFNSPDYITYTAQWELLYKEITRSFTAEDSKETKEIRLNIDALRKNINELSRIIFYGEDNKELRKALYKHMESDKLRLRPEYFAEDIQNDKINISADPYKFNT